MSTSTQKIGYEVGKVVALGGTFEVHGEGNRWPNIWQEPKESLLPEEEPIEIPLEVENVIIEAEPTVIVGEELRNASEQEAVDAIRGFTISNDVTALSDWPSNPNPDGGSSSHAGKMFPTFRPLLSEYKDVEVDELADCEIESRIDGEVNVSGSTSDLKFTIPEMVSHVSQVIHLKPNDIIALGRPKIVDMIYLDDASESLCRIETLGELVNPVVNLGD